MTPPHILFFITSPLMHPYADEERFWQRREETIDIPCEVVDDSAPGALPQLPASSTTTTEPA